MHPNDATTQIDEDHLLNFLVNLLTDAFTLDLAENAEFTPEDFWEVLVGASTDGTSVSTLCHSCENAPHPNTILHHLRTKFDLDSVEHVGNTLLQQNILNVLPDTVEVVIDFHLRPYYGDEDDTEGLYHSQSTAGTTAYHAYATLYARVRQKRYTLAIRRLEDGDTPSLVLAEFLGRLESFPFETKALYLDREFYDSKCVTLLQYHNYAYVMPIVKWGSKIKRELSTGWSRSIEHNLTARIDGHEWVVSFPIMIDAMYQRGKYDEHGVRRHGYAVEAGFIETPRQARQHYTKRFGIESSYRLSEQTTASTTTQDPTIRLVFVVVSLVLQNAWRYIHWEYVSEPRRGGRQLWWWPFTEFSDMVTRAVWQLLGKRKAIPSNKPPDDRFTRS